MDRILTRHQKVKARGGDLVNGQITHTANIRDLWNNSGEGTEYSHRHWSILESMEEIWWTDRSLTQPPKKWKVRARGGDLVKGQITHTAKTNLNSKRKSGRIANISTEDGWRILPTQNWSKLELTRSLFPIQNLETWSGQNPEGTTFREVSWNEDELCVHLGRRCCRRTRWVQEKWGSNSESRRQQTNF